VDELPWLADSEIAPMCAAFEKIMAGCGWEKAVPVIGDEVRGAKVYDLEPDQVFRLADDTEITLAEPEDWARSGLGLGDFQNQQPLRGYATLWDPLTGNGDYSSTRVLVTYGARGCACTTRNSTCGIAGSTASLRSSTSLRRQCGSW
jgi:hypothetical protein